MKRFISSLLVVIILLAGCQVKPEEEGKSPFEVLNGGDETSAQELTCGDRIKRNQSISCDQVEIKFIDYTWDRDASVYTFDYQVTNNQNTMMEFAPATSLEARFFASELSTDDTVLADDTTVYQINPGETVDITSTFTLPDGDDITEVRVMIGDQNIYFKNII